ncbi:MAG: hypothetical protein PHS41_10865 [Victivallaceae bacterium]|nr:hypothetical protein [Victivallaceae bacterium]
MKTAILRQEKEVDGFQLFDFEKTAFSRLTVVLDGGGGEQVALAVGEKTRDGAVDPHPPGFLYYTEQTVTLRPGLHEYVFPIPEHHSPYEKSQALKAPLPPQTGGEIAPFRYAQIKNYRGPVRMTRLAFFPDFDDSAAAFESDDPGLNRIWEFCKYSVKATACFGLYVDGQRERLPYEADAYVNQLTHFCCDASYTIARDTIDFLLRNPNWPTEWRLLMPLLVRDYILYSGDVTCLESWLPALQESLLSRFLNGNGLLPKDPAPGIRDIVDWPRLERRDYEFGPANFVPNSFRVGALNAMWELTGTKYYRDQAGAVRSALRRHMLKNGKFVDSTESGHQSLQTALYALFFGIPEPAEQSVLRSFLRSRGMDCSVFAAQFLLDACYRCGLADHALRLMTDNGMRSWNHMLEKGATITTEAWDESIMPNLDWTHAWATAPGNVIVRRLCGVRPLSPGFKTFTVDPAPAGIRKFYLRQLTAQGPIIVEYDCGKYAVHAPENCRLTEDGNGSKGENEHV